MEKIYTILPPTGGFRPTCGITPRIGEGANPDCKIPTCNLSVIYGNFKAAITNRINLFEYPNIVRRIFSLKNSASQLFTADFRRRKLPQRIG